MTAVQVSLNTVKWTEAFLSVRGEANADGAVSSATPKNVLICIEDSNGDSICGPVVRSTVKIRAVPNMVIPTIALLRKSEDDHGSSDASDSDNEGELVVMIQFSSDDDHEAFLKTFQTKRMTSRMPAG